MTSLEIALGCLLAVEHGFGMWLAWEAAHESARDHMLPAPRLLATVIAFCWPVFFVYELATLRGPDA